MVQFGSISMVGAGNVATAPPEIVTFHMPTASVATSPLPEFSFTVALNVHVPRTKLTAPKPSTIHPLLSGVGGASVEDRAGVLDDDPVVGAPIPGRKSW